MPIFNAGLFNSQTFGGGGGTARVVELGKGILYPALRKAGITLAPGRTPSPAQFQDATDELTRITESLNCDRLFIYTLDIEQFPLQAGKKTYTIGQDPTGQTTADFDVPWPEGITFANVMMSGGVSPLRYKVAILTPQMWSRVALQDISGTIPQALYYDRSYPIGTISIVGQPAEGAVLELYLWHRVPTYQSLDDVVLLPPGYEDTLVLNLAVRLAPHFQREVHPDVRQQARESLMRLQSVNAPKPVADLIGLCGGGQYDIYSDTKQ